MRSRKVCEQEQCAPVPDNGVSARRLSYTAALESWDQQAILGALADDVVIYVAVDDAPMSGKQVAEYFFGVLEEELGAMVVTDEIIEDNNAVLLFETAISDTSAQGMNVVRLDDSGSIRELTVLFRPLRALALIAGVVGARMSERFGSPPQVRD